MSDVTDLLDAAAAGGHHPAAQLLPLVYDELRKLAASRLAAEAPDHTLQPTALVHEAYLRLVGPADPARWASRGHFFAAAAEAMRRILVESARRRQTHKRGERARRAALDPDQFEAAAADPDRWLDLDHVLTAFEAVDPDAASLVRLRVFAGLTVEESAEVLGVSRATAFRVWIYARAWLSAALSENPNGENRPGENRTGRAENA
jgi:RNA polymerase sigma factor (TIGR02999 family)